MQRSLFFTVGGLCITLGCLITKPEIMYGNICKICVWIGVITSYVHKVIYIGINP